MGSNTDQKVQGQIPGMKRTDVIFVTNNTGWAPKYHLLVRCYPYPMGMGVQSRPFKLGIPENNKL